MRRSLSMLTGFLFLASLWSCKIESNQPTRNIYNFNQELSLSTVKKEYSVGDFFRIEVSIANNTLKDIASGADIRIDNATFNVSSDMEVIQIEPLPASIDRFDLIIQNGQADKDDNFPQTGDALLKYGCPENSYTMAIGYQFKQRGNYLLRLNPERLSSLIFFTDNGNCSIQDLFPPPPEADLGNVYYTFDVEDNNLDVFNALVGTATDAVTEEYRQALEDKRAFFIPVR